MKKTIYVDVITRLKLFLIQHLDANLADEKIQIRIADTFFQVSREVRNIEDAELEDWLINCAADAERSEYCFSHEAYKGFLEQSIKQLEEILPPKSQSEIEDF